MGLLLDYRQAIRIREMDTGKIFLAYLIDFFYSSLLSAAENIITAQPSGPDRLNITLCYTIFCDPVSKLWIKVTISGLKQYSISFEFFKSYIKKIP